MANSIGGAPATGAGIGGAAAGSDRCQVVSSTLAAWTDLADAGISEQAFSAMVGTCSAPFTWDASGWTGTLTVNPPTGSSTITATVTLNQSSLRLVQTGATASAPEAYKYLCRSSRFEVDALVTLALPGSNVVVDYPATLTVGDGNAPSNLQFVVDSAQFGSWLAVAQLGAGTTVMMTVEMAPINQACSGNITMTTTTSQGSSGTGFAQGSFASWSDTGCKVGTAPVDLSQPYQGVDITAAIGNAFNKTNLTAGWDDDSVTTLNLGVSVTPGLVCAEATGSNTVVTVPVNIQANTADNRVVSLAGQGTVRASFVGGALNDLELWLSTDLTCQSTTDVLPYRSVDCGQVRSVTAQLGTNRYLNAPTQDFGRLELYVYERNSTASPGAADRVDRLTWSF